MKDLNETLTREECFRRQKSRVKWVIKGERNTRFFHTSMVPRRRKSRIYQLKNTQGHWCIDEEESKKMALQFYKNLYTKDTSTVPDQHTWSFPKLNSACLQWPNRPVEEAKIKKVTFQFGTNKALKPDGTRQMFSKDIRNGLATQW